MDPVNSMNPVNPDTMQALVIDESRKKPTLRPADRPRPEPSGSEILIRVAAAGVNRADLMQLAGQYPPPRGVTDIPGLEVAGVVAAVGPRAARFEPGDPVMALLPGGGYAQYAVVNERLAMAVPREMSMEEAAAVPEAYLTAFQALRQVGEIQRAERVLIHGGASGVGMAAIQVARVLFDADVVVTAGKQAKLKFCRELGAALAIHHRKQSFAEVIEARYGRHAINVIVDIVGESYFESNLRVLSTDGRLVLLSTLGGRGPVGLDLLPLLRRRLTIRGTTLRNRPEAYKHRLVGDFLAYSDGAFTPNEGLWPVVDSIWPWDQAGKALARMEKNRNMGKIVLTGM